MGPRRYDKEMNEVIKGLGCVPPLLLHVCCAPCSSAVLESLSAYFSITVFYYNPNIESEEEYRLRAAEAKRLVSEMTLPRSVAFLEGPYEPERYREAIRGLEAEKEGGKRCEACFRLRLEKTAETAKAMGIPYFTTTLTISPLKNAALLNSVGSEMGERYGVSFLPSDFKKQGGYQRSIELSKQYGLYRQDYCGCGYSRQESEERRRMKEGQNNKVISKRAVVTIDLGNIAHNVRALSDRLPKTMKTILVIKANGYGHGSVLLAKRFENEPRVFGFAVATEDEALELRSAGIEKPVLMLGLAEETRYRELIENTIRFAVASLGEAEEIDKTAKAIGKTALCHIKVDTGMGRIGFAPTDASVEEVKTISELTNLTIEGIFTHLATMDADDPSMALMQADLFRRFTEEVRSCGVDIPYVHLGNSAATILKKGFPFANLTRLGISLYGVYPSEGPDYSDVMLRPGMTFMSRVTFVKTVPAGTPIGYGATYVTDRETVVATVSAGYADGYMRSLSNRGVVVIRGKRCPVIGRVCMDQFMADVTDVPGARPGDPVLLFGEYGGVSLPVEEVADLAGTIPYELLVRIADRVSRTVKTE